MLNSDQIKLLEGYEKYLKEQGYATSSINIYKGRIIRFFKEHYSVNDLIVPLATLIQDYSRSGSKYNPKDHYNTVNALKRLADSLGISY